MNNALDSWIAIAEETKRVDRLSSVLGRECWPLIDLCSPSLTPLWTYSCLGISFMTPVNPPTVDSPALSCGLSPASRGLNAPSLNAFRFLPFLQETFPDLLRYNSKHLVGLSSCLRPVLLSLQPPYQPGALLIVSFSNPIYRFAVSRSRYHVCSSHFPNPSLPRAV